MPTSADAASQPDLFSATDQAPTIDRSFANLTRVDLDETSWVDHVPAWITAAQRLFEELLEGRGWQQRSRWMYDRRVLEPRLTAPWMEESGEPLEPPILEEIRQVLSEHYDRAFDSIGFNLYRDGKDSVAWHADKIPKSVEAPIVALVTLGETRRFLLRPKGGGKSIAFVPGSGDLLVTGGNTQRTWEHSVPKVAKAGPRISLAYRHDMDRTAYDHKRVENP